MKTFSKKTLIFLVTSALLFMGLGFLADGYTDPYYLRFTTPKQKSMIIGSSRAAQGLQPKVFKDILGKEIYNFAFTISNSSFCKPYYDVIIKKHNRQDGGLFIIVADPWSVSSWSKDPNDESSFRETRGILPAMKTVDKYPNYEYLYKNLKGHYKDILFPPSKEMFLHDDGWLEISNISMDSISVSQRLMERGIKLYGEQYLPKTNFSKVRLGYLVQTIQYLKKYGKVYLIRPPVHPEIMKIENKLMPDFDEKLKKAIHLSDNYLDMTRYNERFQYTDGIHLYKVSGAEVSAIIARWIKDNHLPDN